MGEGPDHGDGDGDGDDDSESVTAPVAMHSYAEWNAVGVRQDALSKGHERGVCMCHHAVISAGDR